MTTKRRRPLSAYDKAVAASRAARAFSRAQAVKAHSILRGLLDADNRRAAAGDQRKVAGVGPSSRLSPKARDTLVAAYSASARLSTLI